MVEEPPERSRAQQAAAEVQVMDNLQSLDVASEQIERYGVHPDQFIEWYGPEDGAVVVMIHGGYFHEDGTLRYLRPAALALGESGYHVALAEYRHVLGDPKTSFDDIETLARHPQLENAMWVGHSSGAIFVSHALFSDAVQVRHAVVLAPILELARAADEDANELDINPIALWLQKMPEEDPQLYAQWEPLAGYYAMGAAGFQQRGLHLDVIHGTLDRTVPVARTKNFLTEPFNIALVPGENHYDVIRPGSDSWLLLLGALG
ncbi:MAG: alpha/beta hydrolase [Arcanobacterium sp.]|nr:alpha/beta hydrolase [Arcanobacterium sp.]MDY5273384.1 alpha/beta hydrolase [Arcanobacterium sp.]